MAHIDDYSFGFMTIDGHAFHEDVTIVRGKAAGGWWRKSGHLAGIQDLKDVVAARPKVLVLGTGSSGLLQIDPALPGLLREQGIELIAQPTPQAVATFNRLAQQSLDVAGAFHLTC